MYLRTFSGTINVEITNKLSSIKSNLNIQQYAFGFGDEGTHHPIGKRIGDNIVEITGYAGSKDAVALAIYGLAKELLDQEVTIKYQELEFTGATERTSIVFEAEGFRNINKTLIENNPVAVIICSANTPWLSKNGTYHLTVNIPNQSVNLTVIVNL